MSQHILILAHSENPPLAALVPILNKLDLTYSITRMPFGETPPLQTDVDGLIILGAPASIHQKSELDWLQREMAWVETFMQLNRPIFGICFGCQMLAELLGGSCIPGNKGREFSYVNITLVNDDPLFDAKTLAQYPVFQAHGDTYTLPKGATQLLAGEVYPQQAAKFGKPHQKWYGTQFHPEITANIAGRWHQFSLQRGGDFAFNKYTLEEHIALTEKNQQPLHHWLEGFLGRLFAV